MKYFFYKPTHFSVGFRILSCGKWPKNKQAALKESIRKWNVVLEFLKKLEKSDSICKRVECYWSSCALCQIYIDNACNECPVKQKTGYAECYYTPYDPFPNIQKAENEIEFLTSLLNKRKVSTKKYIKFIEVGK